MTGRLFSFLICINCVWLSHQGASAAEPFLLSSEGSGRATAYIESAKIITFEGRTHVAWLDSPEAGFRVCIRTLDHETGVWSKTYEVGEAEDNHGGPSLTIDEKGYLHIVYFSHHHPFRYSKSVRPNDASEWERYSEFGKDLTYPALVCAKDGTLILTARRSYEDRPWELEMWSKAPKHRWKRKGSLLKSRYGDYAQFAASLAWGPDHETLHLGARIFEMPKSDKAPPYTTVGYMKSIDGGKTWIQHDGSAIKLPATAETFDIIVGGVGKERPVLNAGSIAVDANGLPYVPYSVRMWDTSRAYLATPVKGGTWNHSHLNSFLPEEIHDWDLFMPGGIVVGSEGDVVVAATAMQVSAKGVDWGEPSSELVRFYSKDGGKSFTSELWGVADSKTARWIPNLERKTGFNEIPKYPSLIYTDGNRGTSLDDKLSNNVWWLPGESNDDS